VACDSITVRLDGGEVRHVAVVRPGSQGTLSLVHFDGEVETVGEQHVKSITDCSGWNVTGLVINHRKSVGTGTATDVAASRAKPHHEPCFTPKPLPECKTCMMTQVGFVHAMGSSPYSPGGTFVTLDLGATRNLSPSYALGADLFVRTNFDVARAALPTAMTRRALPSRSALIAGSCRAPGSR
jgi:hypothetical protein